MSTETAEQIGRPSDISKANISRLSDEEKDQLLLQENDEIHDAETMLGPWKQRIVKYYELYKLYQTKKHYEGLADIFVPEILRAVETIVGNIYRAVIQNDPWFEYQGRTSADDASAAALTQLTMYEMDENGFKHRLMDSIRQMATTGLTVRKVLWDFQQVARTRRNFDEMPKGIDPKTQKPVDYRTWHKEIYLDTVKDHWTFEPVDLLSLLIPDISIPYNDMQKSPWIGEQYVVMPDYVRERSKKGWFVDVTKEDYELTSDDSKSHSTQSTLLKESRMRSSGFTIKSNRKGAIEIIERWGLLEAHYVYDPEQLAEMGLEPDDKVETVFILANRKCILKLEANPFWHNQKPYLFCPYVPQEFEFDGIGVGQIGEKLQEELNDTRNQTMDNKTLILMCMWLKSRGSGIKNSDLRVRPLGVVATNDMNGLQPLRPPVLTGVGVNIESTIKNDLRESVGAASNLQGIAQSGVGTATESTEINQASMGRGLLNTELYCELVLRPLLIMAEYLNYQFYDHEKIIRVIGPTGIHFQKITPKMLIGNKDVIVKLALDTGSPAAKRQAYLNFLTLIQQMQPAQIEYHWKLLNQIYKESFGGRDLSDIYDAPQEDADLLELQDEVDIILQGYPLVPQKRDDARQRGDDLEKEYHKYKYALSPEVNAVFQSVILGYHKMALAQLKQAQAQAQMQMQVAAANGQGPKPGVTGQAPGDSVATMPQMPPAQTQGV